MTILFTCARLYSVKWLLLFCLPIVVWGQDYTEDQLLKRLNPGSDITADLLNKRSVVLYSYLFSPSEISLIHETLVKTGVDAVGYFETDKVLGGYDIVRAYTTYFTKREIANIIVIQKSVTGYQIYVTAFNSKPDFVSVEKPAWTSASSSLSEILGALYRSALAQNKPGNFLISETPEMNLEIPLFTGVRYELFAYDLKVDKLAIPKFGDEAKDKQLEEIMKEYPFKYQLVDNTLTDTELRNQGFLYVLRFVHTRSGVAKNLLGYSVSPSESAFVSVTFPSAQMQLKNIPATSSVYKFYPRQIESGNYYLGTKWDGDVTWEQALKNFIGGLKAELKIN